MLEHRQTASNRAARTYVVTSCGEFEVADAIDYTLQDGSTYTIHVSGYRLGVFDRRPVIQSAQKTS